MPGPAARFTDPVTHDTQVPSGVIGPAVPPACPCTPPVIIEGLPAAHVGHFAICTGATAAGPIHPPPVPPAPPGFPIVIGSPTVFIHGQMAARWLPAPDVAACGVFLGLPSLAATRRVIIGP